MTRYLSTLVIVLGLTHAGCDNEPGEGKPKAEVAPLVEAKPEPLTATGEQTTGDEASDLTQNKDTAGTAATYTFSQDGSKVDFVGAKITKKHKGAFNKFSGTIELVDNDPTKSSVKVEVDTASLKADEAKLTKHLKSPDFFDVENLPKATFSSAAIKAGGPDGATHTVTGNLELHGVKKSITFPATIAVGGDKVDVKAEFVINRRDFDINFPGMPNDLIKDDVLIKLDLHATPSKQS